MLSFGGKLRCFLVGYPEFCVSETRAAAEGETSFLEVTMSLSLE